MKPYRAEGEFLQANLAGDITPYSTLEATSLKDAAEVSKGKNS